MVHGFDSCVDITRGYHITITGGAPLVINWFSIDISPRNHNYCSYKPTERYLGGTTLYESQPIWFLLLVAADAKGAKSAVARNLQNRRPCAVERPKAFMICQKVKALAFTVRSSALV